MSSSDIHYERTRTEFRAYIVLSAVALSIDPRFSNQKKTKIDVLHKDIKLHQDRTEKVVLACRAGGSTPLRREDPSFLPCSVCVAAVCSSACAHLGMT